MGRWPQTANHEEERAALVKGAKILERAYSQ
jgi:hypothetical protein